MIEATNQSKPKELIPSGNYVARCYSMIHIGTVDEDYIGEIKTMNKVRITWELPTELRVFSEEKGEQPMVISKEYTLSMHEKSNLRRDLESWRGKGFTDDQAKSFDITKLLGVVCMLNIIHKTTKTGNEFATISNISTMPKGLVCPEQVNPTFEFNFTDKYDEFALNAFPTFIKDKIKSSVEYKKLTGDIIDLPESEQEFKADALDNNFENNMVDVEPLPF
jgi:hypothetical protein